MARSPFAGHLIDQIVVSVGKRSGQFPPCECENNLLRERTMRFERRVVDDDQVQIHALDPFPARLCFSRLLLDVAPTEFIQVGDGIITVTVANGRASYGITNENLMLNTVCGVRSPA